MLKHVVIIILLSALVIVGMPYAREGLQAIVYAHEWVANILKEVFSPGQVGDFIRQLLALLAIPVGIALVPTVIFWLLKRRWFPYFMGVVWVVWLLQTSALVVVYKTAEAIAK